MQQNFDSCWTENNGVLFVAGIEGSWTNKPTFNNHCKQQILQCIVIQIYSLEWYRTFDDGLPSLVTTLKWVPWELFRVYTFFVQISHFHFDSNFFRSSVSQMIGNLFGKTKKDPHLILVQFFVDFSHLSNFQPNNSEWI